MLHLGRSILPQNTVLRAFCGYICFDQISHGFDRQCREIRHLDRAARRPISLLFCDPACFKKSSVLIDSVERFAMWTAPHTPCAAAAVFFKFFAARRPGLF